MSEPARAQGSVPDVELFTQSHCAPCRQVEAFLERLGVPFRRRDVEADPEAMEALLQRGYLATPVTRIGDAWVAGFKRRELERLLAG